MNKILINLENIWLDIDWNQILYDINMDIYENEILSIVWLNWTWKSTLLKLIIWLYKPTTWKIIYHTDKIWYVPQKLDFDKSIPISSIEFLKIYSWKNDNDIIEKLEKLNWTDIIEKNVWTLSWWQLQKLLITNALLQDPKLLLLDEPTTWLDISWEEKFYEILTNIIKEYNMSIILVSHDIHSVFSLSNKVICINKTIGCIGKPRDIHNNVFFQAMFWKYLIPYKHHHHNDK